MVKNRLSQEDAQAAGWLLDGYPRSAEQAEAIQEAGINPDVFILIDVRCQILITIQLPQESSCIIVKGMPELRGDNLIN